MRQISQPRVGFEHTIPASQRPPTDAFDRAATGIGMYSNIKNNNWPTAAIG
jgi:hypothetical protein